MREILFRGFHECETGMHKAYYNGEWHKGEWVYGYYVKQIDGHAIINDETFVPATNQCYTHYEQVAPETVCQYTGLKDKKGRKIFENDIVTVDFLDELGVFGGYTEWQEKALVEYADVLILKEHETEDIEIIGNKFENPEFLEVEE